MYLEDELNIVESFIAIHVSNPNMFHNYLPSYKTLDRNQLTNFFDYSRNSKHIKKMQ
jgi:hypothetical protein